MDKNFIEKYVPDIFAYCIKRLSNIEDARDLSQDILLEVLKSFKTGAVKNPDAWVWKIAHNRYVRHLNNIKYPIVSLDDSGIIETLAEDSDLQDDFSEEKNIVFESVHSIAKLHRDILIDFFISGLTYEQISKKHGIHVNTVKSRLFYGKEKLKERWQIKMEGKKVYNRINWFVCANGCNNPYQYLDRQIARAIATVCYEKPLSVEEISLATGLPCMFIEDELPVLLHGEILTEVKGKYLTNIIIYSAELTKRIEDLLITYSGKLAEMTESVLEKYDKQIRNIGFSGCDKPSSQIWWFLIPVLLREACEEARRLNGKVARDIFPPRRDGGTGWIFANVSDDERHNYFSGCNGYWKDNSILTYFWTSKYFNRDINKYLHRLEDIEGLGLDCSISRLDELMIAEGLKYNVIEKTGNGYRWAISVFTKGQMEQLNTLKVEMSKELANFLLPAVNQIYEMMINGIPKHLHKYIRGVFGAELNSVIAMVCDILEDKGKLEKPGDEYFSRQIIMTLK